MNSHPSRRTYRQQPYQNIQRLFLDHCATIIQSHFRGFVQKKRYRQFLPVYRRVRELLLAAAEGWRVRKVMQLKSTVRTIKSIKEKENRKETIHARIAKR